MTVPSVTSTTPSSSATDVNIANAITATFNTNLDSDSVTIGTFIVYRSDTYDEVEGNISVLNNVATFLPTKALYEDTGYVCVLYGEDANNAAGAIKSSDGDELVTTYRWTFRTAVEEYATYEQANNRADVKQDGPVRLGDLFDPGGLELRSVFPRGFATDLSNDLRTVTFTFSSNIDSTTVTSDSISVDIDNVLGMDEYYGATGVDGLPHLYGCASAFGLTSANFAQPTGTFIVTGTQIIWTRGDAEPTFNYNSELTFELSTDIKDTDGHSLLTDTSVRMTTTYFPKFVSSKIMRAEAGPMLADQFDDTINRIIHKNSIAAWEEAAYNFDIHSPYPAVKKWVRNKTIIDLVDLLSSRAQVLASQGKVLGDLDISYKTPNPDPHLRSAAEKALVGLTDELRHYRGGNIPKVAIKGVSAYDYDFSGRARRWDVEYEYGSAFYDAVTTMVPASNMSLMRLRKLTYAHDAHPHVSYVPTVYFGSWQGNTSLFVCSSSES